jgi:CRP/FNR family transcriptional regulator, nitrogen fixation regulation protein
VFGTNSRAADLGVLICVRQTSLSEDPQMVTPTHDTSFARLHAGFQPPQKTKAADPLASQGVAMSFGRNAEIYAEGETSGYIYKVVSGVVRISKLLPDGRRQISAFHLPGEMFGFESDELYHASAEAVVPTKVIAYRWDGVGAGRQSASFVQDLLDLAVLGLRHTQDLLLLLGRKNALERLAAFLLEMDARTGAKGVVDLAMPRHDIADYLGLTLETVSRMFAELKEKGAIRLESARRVHVLDAEELRAMAA